MSLAKHVAHCGPVRCVRSSLLLARNASSQAKELNKATPDVGNTGQKAKEPVVQTKKKTQAQIDEDMRRAMEGLAGDGGDAGLELEDGKPVAMKRGVRDNMFRYI